MLLPETFRHCCILTFFSEKNTQALFLPGVLLMKEELGNLGDSRLSVVYVCWGSCCALWWILISAGRRTSTLRLLWCLSLSFGFGLRKKDTWMSMRGFRGLFKKHLRYMIYMTDRWWWWFQWFFFVSLPSADGCFCWFGARWFGFLGFSGSQRLTISWCLGKLTGSGGKVTRGLWHPPLKLECYNINDKNNKTMACNLQQVMTLKKSRVFLSICLFFKRVFISSLEWQLRSSTPLWCG